MTRILKRILFVLTGLVVALVLSGTCALYLAVTGKSLPILRALTAYAGRLFAGQRTELLKLDLRVRPADGWLAGVATLTVRSLDEHRQRFYFLLNDGLHLRQVRVTDPSGVSTPINAYRVWLLTIIEAAQPVAKNDNLQLAFDYDGTPTSGPLGAASCVVNAQHVRLNVDAFWYPSDLQGFFNTDVAVTLPERLTVVHNGMDEIRVQRGDVQQVRWTSGRPVAGLSLVAGPYALTAVDADGTRYRLYLPSDVQLEPQRVLRLMHDADHALTDRYGTSGFKQLTMFVDRSLRRGFNDGAGLMGLSIRYFRDGDYGFGSIAHEIAHNWWGATVAANWLSPRTGGQWIVEGLAEFSSLLAAETAYGTQALTRRLAADFFDPAHQVVLANMSVLDNTVAEPTARNTIYRKGAYVAAMLRRTLGDEAYFLGLRQFLDRFHYRQATDGDLQQVLQESSKQDLKQFFADWVHSDRLADLALDGSSQTEVIVNNLGSAPVTDDIALWTFTKDGGEPTRTTVHVGDKFTLDSTHDYAVLDPLLTWADMQRENNRYPRRNDPVYVAVSAKEDVALTEGDGFPWTRASVSSKANDGRTEHTWDFEAGLAGAPIWSPDGARLIVSRTDPSDSLPAIVALAADGTRRTIGRGWAPAAAPDGTVYAGTHDRIVRVAPDGRTTTLVRRPGESLDFALPSPDGTSLVYTAARENHATLRQVSQDGRGDRLIISWDRDRMLYRWSKDGTRLYAIVGGDWDWQIWEIPLAAEPVRVLARGAAAIADLAVSPDGTQLAFTAVPSLNYPHNRHELYVAQLGDRTVRMIDIPDADLTQVAWVDADSLLVVAEAAATERPWILPATRVLKRVRLADGSVEDVK
jgi:Tol biopolymer transport system component